MQQANYFIMQRKCTTIKQAIYILRIIKFIRQTICRVHHQRQQTKDRLDSDDKDNDTKLTYRFIPIWRMQTLRIANSQRVHSDAYFWTGEEVKGKI